MEVAQSYPTLCNPMDCLPGSSVHGILQARILKWVAVPFSRGSCNPGVKSRPPTLQADSLPSEPPGKPMNTLLSHFSRVPVRPHRWQPTRLPCPWDSSGKNIGVGCHFPLQCMKLKSESEVAQSCPTLCDPRDGSPLGSPVPGILQARTLEWVAISFSNA